jgi:hypothetical protein
METKEEPNFDGDEGKAQNMAAVESAPQDEPVADEEEPVEEVLRVRYNGTANSRVLTRADLTGVPVEGGEDSLVWSPGGEIEWDAWLEMAGSDERARNVLLAHQHEFELVGPGAAELLAGEAEEEFSIGDSGA